MKIDIPDDIAKAIGIAGLADDKIEYEVTELAWRVYPNPSGDEKTEGVLVYAKNENCEEVE